MKNNNIQSPLMMLTTAALSLPGISNQAQAAAPQEISGGYRYNKYIEDAIEQELVISGDRNRFTIDVHHASFVIPVSDKWVINADIVQEKLSGASPWYLVPDPVTSQPIQVMSGASIEESRSDLTAGASYFINERMTVAFGAGNSTENDYSSVYGSASFGMEFNNKHSSFNVGLSVSSDELTPTDAAIFPTRVASAEKESLSGFVGFTQVMNKNTTWSASISATRKSGFLSDPYKAAYVAGSIVADSRPEGRSELAWMLRYRRWFDSWNSALHVNYRNFSDNWGVQSHTFETSLHKELAGGFSVTPTVRWYSQSQAVFYDPLYLQQRADGYYSADYRLSPYGALMVGAKLEKAFDKVTLKASFERYAAGKEYALKAVDVENPGLVRYILFSAGLDVKF